MAIAMTQSVLLMVSAVILVFAAWINFRTTKCLCRGLIDLSETVNLIRNLPDTKEAGGSMRKAKVAAAASEERSKGL